MSTRVLSRRTILAGAAAGAAVAASVSPARAASQRRPNIVLLMTDDQHVESVRVMTSVQRRIVEQGTSFVNAFASWPVCGPSRASLLTGQYAHNHGVLGNSAPLGGVRALDATNTLAVWLQQAGYHTAQIGKYINGYRATDPIPPGWSDWNATVQGGGYLNTTLNENGTLVNYAGQYQTDVYAEKGADLVRRAAATGKPFFTWISFGAPHTGDPLEPDDPRAGDDDDDSAGGGTPAVADRHRDAFADEPLPTSSAYNEADVSDKPQHIRRRPLLTDDDKADITERYQQRLESLLAVDEAVDRILDALDETGQADNTLVVFVSDNGFFHGEHRVPIGKALLYEPSTRIPLVMRGPGVPAAVSRTQLVANVDLAPTFLHVAGATPGRPQDGRPLIQLAANPAVAQGRPILLEGAPRSQAALTTAVRTPRYQYTEVVNGEVELYDLRIDPDQLDSRHDDPAYAGIRAELADLLETLRSS